MMGVWVALHVDFAQLGLFGTVERGRGWESLSLMTRSKDELDRYRDRCGLGVMRMMVMRLMAMLLLLLLLLLLFAAAVAADDGVGGNGSNVFVDCDEADRETARRRKPSAAVSTEQLWRGLDGNEKSDEEKKLKIAGWSRWRLTVEWKVEVAVAMIYRADGWKVEG